MKSQSSDLVSIEQRISSKPPTERERSKEGEKPIHVEVFTPQEFAGFVFHEHNE